MKMMKFTLQALGREENLKGIFQVVVFRSSKLEVSHYSVEGSSLSISNKTRGVPQRLYPRLRGGRTEIEGGRTELVVPESIGKKHR